MKSYGSIKRALLSALWRLATSSPLLALLLECAAEASARVGGGHSFSSSRSRGSSSSGSGSGTGSGSGAIFLLFRIIGLLVRLNIDHPLVGIPIDLLIGVVVVFLVMRRVRSSDLKEPAESSAGQLESTLLIPGSRDDASSLTPSERLNALRHYDANFSEILFNDFIYTLYARVQEARGRGRLDDFSPYLGTEAISSLRTLDASGVVAVVGIIIGSAHIQNASDPANPEIKITVLFEANYTEEYGPDGTAAATRTYYTSEGWEFTRKRDVLSRTPENITAIHCPRCGGPLERKPDGSCLYCGVKIVGGDFDWFVTRVQLLERTSQGPALTSDVLEEGTDLPDIVQPGFESAWQALTTATPDFSWPNLEGRIRHMFLELQEAWSSLDWQRARPYETDNVFQTHMFWITEYQRQQMRNILKDIEIARIVPVKTGSDIFFDSVTVRIYARMIDYTVDLHGNRVSGDDRRPRRFSEYWTFIRSRGSSSSSSDHMVCPNCDAPLRINMAGICEYCEGKITSGQFDWVLSRIEQDEVYRG